jgi:mannose-6-phosphate isomerase-like protein (cupin superfamily)
LEKNNLKPLPSLAVPVLIRKQSDLKPFVTKDKSIIREFFHPLHETSKQLPKNIPFSIALATVKPGQKTLKHIHEASTEFYYITRGTGIMQLNSEKEPIEENTLIYIPARTKHTVKNTGKEDLLILCICNPPYTHEDTKITSTSEAC